MSSCIFLMVSEGSLIDACEESETSVDSGSFKYFRTQFQFVTGNQVSVELRDKSGKLTLSCDYVSCTHDQITRDLHAGRLLHQVGEIQNLH